MNCVNLCSRMTGINSIFRLNSIFNKGHGLLFQRLEIPVLVQCAGVKKQTIEEKLGYAVKPKRPLTPYFRYLAQIRSQLKQENPDAKTMEISRLAAIRWEKEQSHIKTQLEEEYKKDQQVYMRNKIEYDKSVTEEQKDDIKQYKASLEEEKLKRDLKKQMRELGKPKKPITSFLRFMKSEEPKCRGNLSFRDWQLKASEMWDKLDPNEKKLFQDAMSKDLEHYKKELNMWEEKMIRLGHVNMVRNQALIKPPSNRSHFSNTIRTGAKSDK